jgi:hypothetical protein
MENFCYIRKGNQQQNKGDTVAKDDDLVGLPKMSI